VHERSFDLVLVDLGLPDGSGGELIDLIRTKQQPTYIVVATIYDDDRHLFNALRAGANGYILKDDDRDSIRSYLAGIEQNQAPFSQRSMTQVLKHFHQQGEERRDSKLTKRQEDVLVLIAQGYTATDTATMLSISENTAKGYIKDIYAALGISSRAEAAAYAIKRNLIEPG
jgi:DNA-binding NarL/FixJ family response regulator